jgi:hypothetical protein
VSWHGVFLVDPCGFVVPEWRAGHQWVLFASLGALDRMLYYAWVGGPGGRDGVLLLLLQSQSERTRTTNDNDYDKISILILIAAGEWYNVKLLSIGRDPLKLH